MKVPDGNLKERGVITCDAPNIVGILETATTDQLFLSLTQGLQSFERYSNFPYSSLRLVLAH